MTAERIACLPVPSFVTLPYRYEHMGWPGVGKAINIKESFDATG
ncbi:hypothetical protein [Sphingobium sp. CCH11-B1]|jgi:hypothetical protein|nr:hypothetical protein [Sphingobium sp. CCH11-B1]